MRLRQAASNFILLLGLAQFEEKTFCPLQFQLWRINENYKKTFKNSW